jgi:hypothetical protein
LAPNTPIFEGAAVFHSYAGRLNFGFTACRISLPHVQDLALHTLAALDELERAAASDQVGFPAATVGSRP